MIFFKRNPKYFARKSMVLFIQSYRIRQLLRQHGPYGDICSQELERMQGIKSMQVYSWKRICSAQGDWQGSWSFIFWVDDSVYYVSGRVRDLDHESMTSL